MSKKDLIKLKPQGKFLWHNYAGDYAGCGYIRIIFPSLLINQFRYKAMSFTTTYNSLFIGDPSHYKDIAFVKFQRAAEENHLKLFIHFKQKIQQQTKTGLIYEVDDLLSPEIPDTNMAKPYYVKNWPYIENMLRLVDGITVSTLPLRNYFLKYNSNISVVPNSLPKFLWGDINFDKRKKLETKKKPRILWAGSQNHFNVSGDGGDFQVDLLNYIKDTQDRFEWVFVGAVPNELKGTNIEIHPWQHIMTYPSYLKSLNVDIGIAPLEKNIFNECKSNIKVLEFSALGIPGVYSNCYPYKNCRLTSDNQYDMVNLIEKLVENTELQEEVFLHDYKLVKKQLFWEDDENILKYINSHLKLFKKILA